MGAMSTLAAHGLIYVPLGYKTTLHIQNGVGEARGGSPWGAGTYTVSFYIYGERGECRGSANRDRVLIVVDFRVRLRLNLLRFRGSRLERPSTRSYFLERPIVGSK